MCGGGLDCKYVRSVPRIFVHKQQTLEGEELEEELPPGYPIEDDYWEDEEPKICADCCHFWRSMDDLFQDQGVCRFSKRRKEHDQDMPCYNEDKYERCHW